MKLIIFCPHETIQMPTNLWRHLTALYRQSLKPARSVDNCVAEERDFSYFSWLLEASGTNNSPFRKVLQNYRAKRCLGARQLTSTPSLLLPIISSHFPLPSSSPFVKKEKNQWMIFINFFLAVLSLRSRNEMGERQPVKKKTVEQYAANKSTILGTYFFINGFLSLHFQYRNISIVFSGEAYIFFRVLTNEVLKGLIGYQNVE